MHKIAFFSCFTLCYFLNLSESLNLNELKKMINYYQPYHVTLIINGTFRMNKFKNMLGYGIERHAPSVIIDLNELETNRLLNASFFRNSRKSTIFLVLVDQTVSFYDIIQMIDSINKLVNRSFSVQPKPKCLLIFYESYLSENEVTKILQYAWTIKFLDFSVLKIIYDDKYLIMNYNPFNQIFDLRILRCAKEIFPDKLKNAENYPLLIPVFDSKPYFFVKTKNGNITSVHGTGYAWIRTVIKKLNFSENFVFESNATGNLFPKALVKLEKSKVNLFPMYNFVSLVLYGRNFLIGNGVTVSYLATVGPILKTSRVYFSFVLTLYLLSFPVIIFIFVKTVQVFKFPTQTWGTLSIYKIFIGMSIADPPRKLVQRFIFLIIAFLSIIYSNIFFSELDNMKVIFDEKNFDSMDEVLNSGMKTYSRFFSNQHDSTEVQNFFSKVHKIDDVKDCISELIKTKSVFCMMAYEKAKSYVENDLDMDRMPIMKIIKLSFYHQFSAFAYEKASPYADKFDKLIQYIAESGIFVNQKNEIATRLHNSEKFSNASEDILIKQLIVILFSGYLIATISFLNELFGFFLLKKVVHSYLDGIVKKLNF